MRKFPLAKITIKPEEQIARAYVDRLILRELTEMESVIKLSELADRLSPVGVGLGAVKSLLASNPDRFTYHERRWIPASRLAAQGRPFVESIATFLAGFGGPVPVSLLIHEVARVRSLPVDAVEAIVRRIIETTERFLITSRGDVALLSWSLQPNDDKPERVIALNSLDAEEVAELAAKLEGHDWLAEGAVRSALEKVGTAKLKVLAVVAYTALFPADLRDPIHFDSRGFAAEALGLSGYVYGPDGTICPEGDAKKWINTALKAADKLSALVELDDAAPIEIKPEDVDRLVARVLSSEASTTATRLLEEFYEITLANKTYPDDMANMMAALRASDKIAWVGGDRFRKANDAPDYITEVPEPFQFVETDNVNEEGDLIDVELNDDGLSTTLRKLLMHPLALDVLDEEPQPLLKSLPETVRLVLKSIHRELGTFPLAQFPTGWLTTVPETQEVIFIDPNGRELQVWVNHDARLMFNLLDWWYEQSIESGAVFTLTRTTKPNVFEFNWMDQPDPIVYISNQRMEELRQMGLESEGKSTLDILIQVMAHWPKGADYLTILAEVNVVRRTSRRLVASLLSSYQCFYQRSGSPVWHFDAKKVDQGFDKTKRKFVKK